MRFLISSEFLKEIRSDLIRKIPKEVNALERVGFLFTTIGNGGDLLPASYLPIKDEEYVEPPQGFGAFYNQEPIRKVIERIKRTKESVFSIHIHEHNGMPTPSLPDLKSEKELNESFARIVKTHHGAIILSKDSMLIRVWNPFVLRIELAEYQILTGENT